MFRKTLENDNKSTQDLTILSPRNEIIRRLDGYSASLVVENITSEHSGNYTCIASNVAGTEKFTVPLTVNVPPKWLLEPKDSGAQAGQDVLLHCQSEGYPKPTITWKKAIGTTPGEYKDFIYEPNITLFPNGSIYFKKITKESQGHYLCDAKNNIGSGVSKVIFLKVNGKEEEKLIRSFKIAIFFLLLLQFLLILQRRINSFP